MFEKSQYLVAPVGGWNFMADIRRDIGMAKENWPPAIGGPLQQNAPNILFEMLIILSASEYTIIQCLF